MAGRKFGLGFIFHFCLILFLFLLLAVQFKKDFDLQLFSPVVRSAKLTAWGTDTRVVIDLSVIIYGISFLPLLAILNKHLALSGISCIMFNVKQFGC